MLYLIALFFPLVFSAGNTHQPQVRMVNFDQLYPYLHKSNDTIYLVNFWATWCGPCRKEMPAIEETAQKYRKQKVKILLVSLDFPNQLDEALIPYIKSHHISSEVLLLNDSKQNIWIDKVDPAWSGGLPYTLVYGSNFRKTYDRPVQFNELDSLIKSKLVTL